MEYIETKNSSDFELNFDSITSVRISRLFHINLINLIGCDVQWFSTDCPLFLCHFFGKADNLWNKRTKKRTIFGNFSIFLV